MIPSLEAPDFQQ